MDEDGDVDVDGNEDEDGIMALTLGPGIVLTGDVRDAARSLLAEWAREAALYLFRRPGGRMA